MIKKLEQIFEILKNHGKKHLVVSCANDAQTIGAVNKSIELGFINATLVGNKNIIEKICLKEKIDIEKFNIIHQPIDKTAMNESVKFIKENSGDILMKGMISSDKYMHAILNKEYGFLSPKATLTHIAVLEHPHYHKLLFCSDVAIIPEPNLKQKLILTNFVIRMAHKFGIEKPKIAIISATDQIIITMEDNVHGAIIAKMAERGQLENAIVDGPLALDVAIDKKAVKIKKLLSDVAGDADGLIFPNIDVGNVFYKTSTILGKAEVGGIVVGAKVPCVLSSRVDSKKTKLYSIALGALLTT